MRSSISRQSPILLALVAALLGGVPASAQEPIAIAARYAVESRVLGETRQVAVWTPAGRAAGRRYPVLYLTDAETQFGHTVTTAEFLARNGRMPQAVVVGIFNTDRVRDLTPYKPDDREIEALQPTLGGADRFAEFIETELVPWVDQKFPTAPFRMFSGHSYGGLFAAHVLATRPDLFHALIATSPTLYWKRGEPVKRLQALMQARGSLKRTLFVTVGAEGHDMQRGFEALERALEGKAPDGLRWQMVEMPREDHGSIVLRSVYAGLEMIFDEWRVPRQQTNTFTGDARSVVAHYQRVSERLDWDVLPPEGTVNQLGYAALARGATDAAIELFRLNVRNYPDSPNAYDSLGEGLEKAGNRSGALAQYEEAVKRAEAARDPLLPTFRRHRNALADK